ncbi:unnamed protein product [Rotaria sordida]|uniref:Uncharacterized protein n=1 Tax=Rotaria sordida TaxID=392033 RepID=A0A815GRN9_9BILA|nr:unnamed protein product [Rotaria sordida]CAF1598174.1 unnamed protein product [Rotaria sordida]
MILLSTFPRTVTNSAKFYDVWIKCSKVNKQQQFDDIIVFTKNDFRSSLHFDNKSSVNANNESSTFITTKKLSSSTATTTGSSTILTPTSTPTHVIIKKRQGAFDDISFREKRRRLSDLNSELDNFAITNNITVNQVPGYFLYQRNYNNNKYLAKLGQELYEGKDIDRPDLSKLDTDQTLALKSHLNLSRVDMNFFKCFSSDFIIIPNENLIQDHSNTLIPTITSCREEEGIMVSKRQQALQLTIQRIIDVLQLEMIQVPNELCYREKTGHDGAGLDQCNSGSRIAGGTSTTGAQGRKFFSYEIRHLLLTCVPLQHQETLKQLIQRYSIVLRAVSSTRSINVSKFKELTLGFQIIIANQKWIDYSMTVHNLIFHSTELIERNNGVALGELSDEALESCNKDVRNYREFLSRKCGHIMNLTDVFNRLFIRSDPLIRKVIKDSFSKRQTRVSEILIKPENEDDKLLNDVFLCK